MSFGRGNTVHPTRRVPFKLIWLLTLFFAGGTTELRAQEFKAALADLSAQQVIAVRPVMKAPPSSPAKRQRRALNRWSLAALIAGEGVDSWGTYKNLSHTKWICGSSPAFAGGYDTNVPGQISSLGDVENACGVGPGGHTANWAFDVTRVGYFSEGGWVSQLHLTDNRNYGAVEGWNLGNDLVWFIVANRLAKRSDWIGKCGPALNFGRGIVHLQLGIANFLNVSHHQNPNTLNLYLPAASNFNAPRWWGRQ